MTNAADIIDRLINSKKPVTLGTIARELGVSELEAARALPKDACAFVKEGVAFETVWEELVEWEKVTLFIIHCGHVFEIQTKLSAGKTAMGFYNMLHDSVVGGHLKADGVAATAFVSMPFMGRESHFVGFFGKEGELQFSVYVGREKHKLIESVRDRFFDAKTRFCGE